MRPSPFAGRVAGAITARLAGSGPLIAATPGSASTEQTVCQTGTLVSVSVPTQTVHLDTDAEFQNSAQSSVVFSEDMQYQFTLTSPSGLASPAPLTGMIQRIPTTTLAPFSGTLNFMGPSAVVAVDEPRRRGRRGDLQRPFTGAGSVPFHVHSMISEVLNDGGGNVHAIIDAFVAATVQVRYTYAVPQVSAAPPVTAPSPPPAPGLSPQFTG